MMEQLVGCGFVLVQMTSLHLQDIVYPSTNANFYKFGISPPGSTSYYDPTHIYEVHDNGLRNEEYGRPLENSSTTTNEQTSRVNTEWEVNENRTSHDDPVECKFWGIYW